jgi:hypothetical protein
VGGRTATRPGSHDFPPGGQEVRVAGPWGRRELEDLVGSGLESSQLLSICS